MITPVLRVLRVAFIVIVGTVAAAPASEKTPEEIASHIRWRGFVRIHAVTTAECFRSIDGHRQTPGETNQAVNPGDHQS